MSDYEDDRYDELEEYVGEKERLAIEELERKYWEERLKEEFHG